MPNFPYLPPDYCPDCGRAIPQGQSCPCYAGQTARVDTACRCDSKATAWGVIRPSSFHYEGCALRTASVAIHEGEQPVARMVALDDGLGTVILEFIGERPPAGTVLYARGVPAVDPVEAKAREIYDGWAGQKGWVPWVEGGNSHKQDEARRQARTTLGVTPAEKGGA